MTAEIGNRATPQQHDTTHGVMVRIENVDAHHDRVPALGGTDSGRPKTELNVERHQRASTIVTSNHAPDEIVAMLADPLLA